MTSFGRLVVVLVEDVDAFVVYNETHAHSLHSLRLVGVRAFAFVRRRHPCTFISYHITYTIQRMFVIYINFTTTITALDGFPHDAKRTDAGCPCDGVPLGGGGKLFLHARQRVDGV